MAGPSSTGLEGQNPILHSTRGGGLLPRQLSGFIFEDAERQSAIMQRAGREDLPMEGVSVPVITGRPTAGWVAEGNRKPLSNASVGVKVMDPVKLSTIVPFSEEWLRTDSVNLFERLRPLIAEAFAYAFDTATLLGVNTPFDNHLAETTNEVVLGTAAQADGGIYQDFVSAIGAVLNSSSPGRRNRITGWVVDDIIEPVLLGATDTQGRPLMVAGTDGGVGSTLIGRPWADTDALYSEAEAGPDTITAVEEVIAIGGDFRRAKWGAGGSIEYRLLDQATLAQSDGTLLHLAQENLAALRAEAWYGWVVENPQAFVRVKAEDGGTT